MRDFRSGARPLTPALLGQAATHGDAALVGELDGIADEVVENLPEPQGIAAEFQFGQTGREVNEEVRRRGLWTSRHLSWSMPERMQARRERKRCGMGVVVYSPSPHHPAETRVNTRAYQKNPNR